MSWDKTGDERVGRIKEVNGTKKIEEKENVDKWTKKEITKKTKQKAA